MTDEQDWQKWADQHSPRGNWLAVGFAVWKDRQREIERLRHIFRVNVLRIAPGTSHEEIDRVLNGEPHH